MHDNWESWDGDQTISRRARVRCLLVRRGGVDAPHVEGRFFRVYETSVARKTSGGRLVSSPLT